MNKILNRLFIGGSLSSSFYGFEDKEKHTRLTKEERIQTKKVLARLNKIDAALKEAGPIAAIGVLGWSLIWLYRGFCYQCVRGKLPLHTYVDKTYNIARIFGIGTMLAAANFYMSSTNIKENKEVKK